MSEEISKELFFFLHAAFAGMVLLIAYDVLRIIRRIFKHGSIVIAIEDFIYWFCSSLLIFYILLKENDGIIRWFFVVGILLGMILYNVSISQYIVRFLAFIINKILYFIGKMLKIMTTPIRIVRKLLIRTVKKIVRIEKKIIKNIKKRLKKLLKTVKIGLSKK